MSSTTGTIDTSHLADPAFVRRIVHIHVPKTAGTAIWQAFRKAGSGKFRTHRWTANQSVEDVLRSDVDMVTGHMGFRTAEQLGGQFITVLRNPVDQFISMYYYLRREHETGREKSQRSSLASRFSLEQLAQIKDDPALNETFLNPSTWRIAHDASQAGRRELRMAGQTDDDVFGLAVKNLSRFAAVGLQEYLDQFCSVINNKFSIQLSIPTVNATENRPAAEDLGISTLRRVQDWVVMDYALYDFALKMSSAASKAKSKPPRAPGAGAADDGAAMAAAIPNDDDED